MQNDNVSNVGKGPNWYEGNNVMPALHKKVNRSQSKKVMLEVETTDINSNAGASILDKRPMLTVTKSHSKIQGHF